MKNSFIPINIFKNIFSRWFYLPLTMILGGLLGLILHGFLPSIYEAQSKFVVTIDYTKTGYLSDIQEDQAMRGIGSLIGSDYILQRTVDGASSFNPKITLADIKDKSRLERGEFEWFIRIRDKNARNAAELVNLWANQANQVLTEAATHSFRAEELFKYLDSIEMCLQRISSGAESKSPCDLKNVDQILEEIKKVGEIAYQEKEASRGLMPAVSVNLIEKGQVPTIPIIYAKNAFVFVGAMIGMILILIWFFQWKRKSTVKRARD
jgi:hypothetical protein